MNTLTDDLIYIGVPLGLVLAGWIWLRYFVKPNNREVKQE